jgi:hypothetical protein
MAITNSIDVHVKAERGKDDNEGSVGVLAPRGLMAQKINNATSSERPRFRSTP